MTDFDEIIHRAALLDLTHQANVDAGLVSPAEQKAHEAHRAELVALLDQARGSADVTYAQFRTAFEAGANCALLFELRNGMNPKDSLKDDANDDLRNVGCYSPSSTRQG